jgi:phage FluMu protein Com
VESKKYIITCPLCGRMLLKSQSANEIELQCPKCSAGLIIKNLEGILSVCEDSNMNYKSAKG